MSAWPRVPLSGVAEIEREIVLPDCIPSGATYVGLENIASGGEFVDVGQVTNGELKSTKFAFGSGHILYGKLRPYLAKIALPSFSGVCSTDILPIRPGPKVDRRYLAYFLRKPEMVELASARSTGANLPRLSPQELAGFEVPLPPLPEQRRIAAMLDQADALRAKRRAVLARLDEMARAIFVEMFGDPEVNPVAFPVGVLADLGTLDRGVSKHRPRNAPELLGGRYPLIQTGDVASSNGYIKAYKSTYSEVGLRQSKMWPAGTLCITIAANIARVGVLTFDACFPDSVVGFLARDPDTVEYVRVWFSFVQKKIEENAPAFTQKNINLAILRTLPLPIPPKELRAAFALRIRQIGVLDEHLHQAYEAADTLFSSLQHRAFRGEL